MSFPVKDFGPVHKHTFTGGEADMLAGLVRGETPFPVALDFLREHPSFEALLETLPPVIEEPHRVGMKQSR